jgi:tetratricopeptide (TPR) repeat protein
MVHIYAGNLLMTTGSYEDATKAFTNADNIKKSSLALYQRARCHVALNNMSEALQDLKQVIDITSSDKVAQGDKECLNALFSTTNNNSESPKNSKMERSVFE